MAGLADLQHLYEKSLKSLALISERRKERLKKEEELIARKAQSQSSENENYLGKPMFPITANMLFLSFLFWIIISFLTYLSISYGLMYVRIADESDLDAKCTDVFSKVKEENMKRVENYTIGEAGPYLHRLRPSRKADYPIESNVLPPLVTGITSAQFYQGFLRHIMVDMKSSHSDMKLIVYDLGLSERERELLEKYCHCQIRDLHTEHYPGHVATVSNYAWRPIVLQNILEEFGAVLYIEPTTRFKDPSSLNYLRMRGAKSYFLWDPLRFTSLIAYTEKGMFNYLKESRCAFLDSALISSEAIALYKTKATWDELMKPWLICALNFDCIAPKYATYTGCFTIRHPHTTGCHRFDMSALSIILNRGVQYTVDSEKMISFRLTYTDNEEVAYFPEQQWTYTQICLVITGPILFVLTFKYFSKRRRFCKF